MTSVPTNSYHAYWFAVVQCVYDKAYWTPNIWDLGNANSYHAQTDICLTSSDFRLSSVFFSFCGKVTTDSYTITASPSFGFLRVGSSAIYSSFDDRSKSSSDLDGKPPLLSDQERIHRKENLNRISRGQSSLPEKASFNQQLTGELPIGHGCSFTQTVFNGKPR